MKEVKQAGLWLILGACWLSAPWAWSQNATPPTDGFAGIVASASDFLVKYPVVTIVLFVIILILFLVSLYRKTIFLGLVVVLVLILFFYLTKQQPSNPINANISALYFIIFVFPLCKGLDILMRKSQRKNLKIPDYQGVSATGRVAIIMQRLLFIMGAYLVILIIFKTLGI